MQEKTLAELEELKARWLDQPYWVLENTKGFEAHRDELRQFRLDMHARQEQERLARLIEFINQYEAGRQNKWVESAEPESQSLEPRQMGGRRSDDRDGQG